MNRSRRLPLFLALLGLGCAGQCLADAPGVLPAPEPPDLPTVVRSGVPLDLEPEVTIIQQDEKTIYQYSVNGVVYLVKIQPDIGPPYYLVDVDGDGNLDVRESDIDRSLRIPQWVLFRW